jgi:hypothetical protein
MIPMQPPKLFGFSIVQWLAVVANVCIQALFGGRIAHVVWSGLIIRDANAAIWFLLALASVVIVTPYFVCYQIICRGSVGVFWKHVWWTCVAPFVLGFLLLKGG